RPRSRPPPPRFIPGTRIPVPPFLRWASPTWSCIFTLGPMLPHRPSVERTALRAQSNAAWAARSSLANAHRWRPSSGGSCGLGTKPWRWPRVAPEACSASASPPMPAPPIIFSAELSPTAMPPSIRFSACPPPPWPAGARSARPPRSQWPQAFDSNSARVGEYPSPASPVLAAVCRPSPWERCLLGWRPPRVPRAPSVSAWPATALKSATTPPKPRSTSCAWRFSEFPSGGRVDWPVNSPRIAEPAADTRGGWRSHEIWLYFGPAFIASVAYIDPGNFAANIQGGAQFGYLLLWVLLWSNLIAMLVQFLSAKLGIATGKTLPQLCRERFSRPAVIGLWLVAEVAAMATDV